MDSGRIPSFRRSHFRNSWRESLWRRWRRWFRPLLRCLWPFGRGHPQSSMQEITEEVSDGSEYPISLDKGQAHHVTHQGQRWSKGKKGRTLDLQEIRMMRTLQPGTRAKLLESLLPALQGRTVPHFSTFLCSYWDFATIPQFLDQLFSSTICHTVVTMPERFCTDFHQPLHFPSLKVKIDHVQVSLPGLDTGASVYVLLTNLRHPELFEAETDEPQALPRQALEPVPAPPVELGPALHSESPVQLGPPPASVPAAVPGEEPPQVIRLKLEDPSKPSCPSPVATMNRPRGDLWDIRAFPPKLLAEQLTLMDAELFREVVPYDCLGSIWSQRHKKGKEHLAPTVRATVAQFNNVANCVITTCLGDDSRKAQDRARVLEHWIKVARECLVLRNFSSVHAILSALQSTPIHRMRSTWREVSRKGSRSFANLCRKEKVLSKKVGTVKLATLEMNHQRAQMRQRQQKKGIVPFLGTYLSDLVMLDAAMDDYVDGKVFNTQKRRKEVKVLREIQLLQVAANNYHIEKEEEFGHWFTSTEWLSDNESYKLSCQLEPPSH